MVTFKDEITIEELVQYQQLKNKIEPNKDEVDIEWLGADIAIPAEIIEGKDCNEQEIDIHIYGKTSSVTRVLSLDQAKGFLEDLLDVVRAFEPDYMLDKNQESIEQALEIEPVSLLASQDGQWKWKRYQYGKLLYFQQSNYLSGMLVAGMDT